MKLLFDFLPIILFFVTFKSFSDPNEGMMAATAVAIAAAAFQVGFTWLRNRRVEKVHLVTLALILVLGGATLLFRDEMFFKWKPTAVNWLFALAFLGSQFFGSKPLVQRMMEGNISLKTNIWTRLNLVWVAFFAAMGFANLYVVYNFDTDTWVDFKLFGMMGMTLLFVIAQAVYLVRHMKVDEEP